MMKSGYDYFKQLITSIISAADFFINSRVSKELEVGGSLVGGVLPIRMKKLNNVESE